MALRKHRTEAPKDTAPPDSPIDWLDIHCRLVTPLYGGGVQAATVDDKMPVRISALRGQLRFWWRLLAAHRWRLGLASDIRRAEFQLWGGMGSDDADASASLIFLRVRDVREVKKVGHNSYYSQESPLPYVFFPADNPKGNIVNLLQEGLHFTLQLRFAAAANDTQRQQVVETLRWWATFGGLGARSRRGTGAVLVEQADDYLSSLLQPVTPAEAEQAGCRLVLREQNSSQDPLAAWKQAITRLRDFRQKAGVGRNPPGTEVGNRKPAGRRLWPEADAVRRLSGRHAALHKPEHPAGNIFPRGMFGMPIIFQFKDRNAGEPTDHQLLPQGKKRLPSPLILRPYHCGNNQWAAAALLLPHDGLRDLAVELKGTQRHTVTLWNQTLAVNVQPLNGDDDPLHAFMNYFTAL